MNTRLHRIQRASAALMALTLLAGCVVVPARPGYGGGYVGVAPPEARVEVMGVAPAPGYFWIDGFWSWVGGRHEWVPGRWEAHREGYRWVPHAWVHESGGWRAHEGHWERR